MCPRPQAGSRHVIELRGLLETTTCSIRTRVAQGGVGKSSRLFLSSALCAITAWVDFWMFIQWVARLRLVYVLSGVIRTPLIMAWFGKGHPQCLTVLSRWLAALGCPH